MEALPGHSSNVERRAGDTERRGKIQEGWVTIFIVQFRLPFPEFPYDFLFQWMKSSSVTRIIAITLLPKKGIWSDTCSLFMEKNSLAWNVESHPIHGENRESTRRLIFRRRRGADAQWSVPQKDVERHSRLEKSSSSTASSSMTVKASISILDHS